MNLVFFALIAAAFAVTAVRQIGWGGEGAAPMEVLSAALLKAADQAVTLSIGLVGVMALFLGLMKVAEEGGLLAVVARLLRPVMERLFPEVPAGHPAMGAMIFNIAANVLGLGNAATPFGIRAMQELDRLNPHKGTATNAMVLFLAINTASVTLLPTSVIALRAAAGSKDAAGIVGTTLFATLVATTVAIVAAKLLIPLFPVDRGSSPDGAPAVDRGSSDPQTLQGASEDARSSGRASAIAILAVVALVPLTLVWGRSFSAWIMPGVVVGLLGFGLARGVKVYESFVEGAREGFQVGIRIIPYLVAILVAIAMLRESGALELLMAPLGRVTEPLGLPAEGLTMALMRALSGSGAYAMLAAIFQDHGADSYLGYLASTIQGSTETTFYVIAVYFGAAQVRRIRHALIAGLLADVAGLAAAVAVCLWVYGR